MTSILINDDLLLRSFQPEDAAELFRCVDAARAELRPWLNWVDATTKPEHSLEFIQMATAWQHSGEGLALGIFLQKSRQFIGTIGMSHFQSEQKRAQIGYWLDPSFQGKGYMFRSAVRFVDFLFSKLNLNKIEMHMIPTNQRSIALAARLGAVAEGRIRQSYFSGGSLQDIIITGILRSEWDSKEFIL
ncbi:MAG: GNAT family protein [Chitinophagaceae bacterium]